MTICSYLANKYPLTSENKPQSGIIRLTIKSPSLGFKVRYLNALPIQPLGGFLS